MNKFRLLLLAGLCIFIAILGIGYLIFGMGGGSEDETSSGTEAPSTTASSVPEATTKPNETQEAATNPSDSSTQEATTAQPVTQGPEYAYAYAGFNPSVAAIDDEKWNLLLVNQKYILPEDYRVNTQSIGSGQSLDYRVVPYYNDMVAAAKEDGITLIPVSGYRTWERQKNNFERKINHYVSLGYSKAEATRLAAKIVLLPGTSEHNAGLAMDFGTPGNTSLEVSFEQTDAFKWLSENAADYGFILRYEADTQDITMVTYEPWHWRYVGVEAAKEIKSLDVTLEEYLGIK